MTNAQGRKKGSGGKRIGAGNKGLYGEKTKLVQFKVPKSKVTEFKEKVKKILSKWVIKKKK